MFDTTPTPSPDASQGVLIPFPADYRARLNTGSLPYNRGVWAIFDNGKTPAHVAWVFWSSRYSAEAFGGEAYEIDGEGGYVTPDDIRGWTDCEADARRAAALLAAEYA